MYTEEEAKTKWCPFARAAFEWLGKETDPTRPIGPPIDQRVLSASVNRGSGLSEPCRCIASECMAWRWIYTDHFTHVGTGETKGGKRSELGYCGLAGKSE